MMTHRKFLETNCPNLARDCDEVVDPNGPSYEIDEADVFEAHIIGYDEGYSEAGKAGTIFALFFGLACGLLGWAIGRWL